MAKLFTDDKTFVDKPTIKPEQQVLKEFAQIGGRNASAKALRKFVADNFGEEGSELKEVELEELNTNPSFLNKVADPLVRAFGHTVNSYWKTLIREQDLSTLCDGCVTSMLKLKYHFVVPGGRFREIYYWDTYFTLEGMLRSGLHDLAKSNIRDLLFLVKNYGFVPNGARLYYLNRSQPPLLTLMVKLYYEHTGDTDFVKEALPLLQREYRYWMDKHSVKVPCPLNRNNSLLLNRYIVDTDQPRPEAYSDDYELAHNVSNTDAGIQATVYADMATGAESGWDFSIRWVRDVNAPEKQILQTIHTRQVVPVELNAILYQIELALAEFGSITRMGSPEDYHCAAMRRRQNMEAIFLDKESGLFFDYLLDENRRSPTFTAASLWPYWSFGADMQSPKTNKAFEYLSRVLANNKGGIPSTLNKSGQQWDWPMAWPPLQYVAMQAALKTQQTQLSVKIAQAFVDSVFCAWYNTGGSIPDVLLQLPNMTDSGHIFEKFNSFQVGKQGGGGEYTVQAGFGWTNGVLLWALDMFGPQLTTPKCPGVSLQMITQPVSSAPAY
ncbi:glycoside hydrolase [Coemansia reversa NRRL 1564]|uniref:Trehalase n=1 Tax=Coemansia reversa (strain ATCC 12441 / NRRL 1564) TaxID=763665 RepID=A0A2G5B6I6_COERN|nr:glycoside hydrolase [Coemansia reversa NRRL 1564]|eukprot:PIA14618.1 glycoside hydrolase [Coemansia reversa NRRL 1564]